MFSPTIKEKNPTHTIVCTSLQNLSKSFKLCYDSWFQSIKEFSPGSRQLLCLYHPVMSWIGWIKMMEGEMTSALAERKIWISQTNHGKNDKKFGSTLISFLSQRKFGPPPSSSMVRLFFLYKKEHSSFRQQETNNGRGAHVKWRTMTSTNSRVPFVLTLKRVTQ